MNKEKILYCLTENMAGYELERFMQRHMNVDSDEILSMSDDEKQDAIFEFAQNNEEDVYNIYSAYIDENGESSEDEDAPTLLDIYDWKEDQEDEAMMYPNGKDDD